MKRLFRKLFVEALATPISRILLLDWATCSCCRFLHHNNFSSGGWFQVDAMLAHLLQRADTLCVGFVHVDDVEAIFFVLSVQQQNEEIVEQ
eukprot:scaffold3714_cov113-Cylindrotheca_fusiformis.AAC.2